MNLILWWEWDVKLLEDKASRMESKWHQNGRVHQSYFLQEVLTALADFFPGRPPRFWKHALYEVGHVKIFPVQPSMSDQPVKDLTRRADKHGVSLVLSTSRRLCDQKHAGRHGPLTRNGVCSGPK